MSLDLSLERISEARALIAPAFLDSPQYVEDALCAALGRHVCVKVETINPVRCFKGRGADLFMRGVDPSSSVVCASSGNFGQAIAYAGRRRGVLVEVYCPAGVNPTKLARMQALGARVTTVAGGSADAKERARAHADAKPDCLFVEDGAEPAIAEGAATIGVELLSDGPFDAIVVPVGDGSLISGIGCWVKAHAPSTRIVGVGARGAPALADSWRAGTPVPSAGVDTIADGIAIAAPVARSIRRMREVVDDMVLVEDSALIGAIRLASATLGLMLEPAGAAGLAAIASAQVPGERLATVLTGSNLRPDLRARTLASEQMSSAWS